MPDFNARIELDSRDFDEPAIDNLMDVVAEYSGVVARATHGGRVELIFTVPADNLRQATTTALSVVLATGHQVYALEVLPTDEFHRRIEAVAMPQLVSVPQAAELLGVTRQAVLAQVTGGRLPGQQVGSTWTIPRATVLERVELNRMADHLEDQLRQLKAAAAAHTSPTSQQAAQLREAKEIREVLASADSDRIRSLASRTGFEA